MKIPIIVGLFFDPVDPHTSLRMATTPSAPELVITLSRNSVGLEFAQTGEEQNEAWKSQYKLDALFQHEQVSGAMDEALRTNPALTDPVKDVVILIVDAPNVFVPGPTPDPKEVESLAGKYLRTRAGDILTTDNGERVLNLYHLPQQTLQTLKEFYANAGALHLSSVIWTAIRQVATPGASLLHRMFVIPYGHHLLVFGEHHGALLFSKTFFVKDSADAAYYALACSRLLNATEHWWFTIEGESNDIDPISIPSPVFHFKHQLPALRQLIASHLSCVS